MCSEATGSRALSQVRSMTSPCFVTCTQRLTSWLPLVHNADPTPHPRYHRFLQRTQVSGPYPAFLFNPAEMFDLDFRGTRMTCPPPPWCGEEGGTGRCPCGTSLSLSLSLSSSCSLCRSRLTNETEAPLPYRCCKYFGSTGEHPTRHCVGNDGVCPAISGFVPTMTPVQECSDC